MIAGPNGSGKSTLIAALRSDPDVVFPQHYINADDIQRARGISAAAAQAEAQRARAEALQDGRSFAYETVMSHPSHLAVLQQAAAQDYEVTLHFVSLDSPDRNVERVAWRVADGGHDVPEDRTRARYQKTMAAAPSAIALSNNAYVYDNSSTSEGMELQAVLTDNKLVLLSPTPRSWVSALVAEVNERATELEAMIKPEADRGLLVAPAVLQQSATVGPVVAQFKHYALQFNEAHERMMVHDKALLPSPINTRDAVRIEYNQGVATVTPTVKRGR